MTARRGSMVTKHSPRVYVVIDPVQDYEESLTILGVHGSLAAAKVATRRYRRTAGPYQYGDGEVRDTHVELRQGDQVLDTWEFRARTGRWHHVAPEEIR